MFEQAFLSDANRPTAEGWVKALTEMSNDLQKCADDNTHYFINSLLACPWCEIESYTGILLFQGGTGDPPAGRFDIFKTWMDILNVPAPSNDTLLKKSSVLTSSTVTQGEALVRRFRNYGFGAAGFVFVVLYGLFALNVKTWISVSLFTVVTGLAVRVIKTVTPNVRDELVKLENLAETQLAEARKLRKGNNSSDPFSKALRELTAKRTQYDKLSHLRFQKIDEWRKALREHQMHEFLSGQRIEDYALPEIEDAEIIALESCGIDNGENVSELQSREVPGLKPSQRNTLEEWRSSLHDKFRDQPRWDLSRADLDSVEAGISRIKAVLQKELQAGAKHLKHIGQQMRSSHKPGHPSVKDCMDAYLQTKVYIEECSPKFWITLSLAIYAFSLVALVGFYVRSVI